MKSFWFYTSICWYLASIVYVFLAIVLPWDVFGALYGMYCYHDLYPFQFIFVAAVIYGPCAALWRRHCGHFSGLKRVISVLGTLLVSVIVSSMLGGLLYAIQDVRAGFVPPVHTLFNNLTRFMMDGLFVGWLILALSFPFSILGAVVGYIVTEVGDRFLNWINEAGSPDLLAGDVCPEHWAIRIALKVLGPRIAIRDVFGWWNQYRGLYVVFVGLVGSISLCSGVLKTWIHEAFPGDAVDALPMLIFDMIHLSVIVGIAGICFFCFPTVELIVKPQNVQVFRKRTILMGYIMTLVAVALFAQW